MKRAWMLMFAAALLAPVSARSSAAEPELRDPQGDAQLIQGVGPEYPFADITGVWFSNLTDSTGSIVGFEVHLDIAAARADDSQEATFYVSWLLGDTGCNASVGFVATHDFPLTEPETDLSYTCRNSRDNHYADVEGSVSGNSYTAEIPFSVFTDGDSRLGYQVGATLHDETASADVFLIRVSIVELNQPIFARVDEAPNSCVQIPIIGGGIGSLPGCPHGTPATPYTIGG